VPYGVILAFALVSLPIVYAIHPRPSLVAKVLVVAAAVASATLGSIPGVILEVGVCVYVLLYLKAFPIRQSG
jgi:uncharacterized membrane protein